MSTSASASATSASTARASPSTAPPSSCAASASTRRRRRTCPPSATTSCGRNGRGSKDLGVNYVRLAHYPHAKLEYDLADEQGVLVWAENGHSNERKIQETGDTITREMVLQNYNHPSIVMWSVGNETGFLRVNRYAAVVKATDPSRIVAYASNIGTKGKRFYPDLDLIAQNTYRGWYFGDALGVRAEGALHALHLGERRGGGDHEPRRLRPGPPRGRRVRAGGVPPGDRRGPRPGGVPRPSGRGPDVHGLELPRLRHREVQGRPQHQGPAHLRRLQEGRLVPVPLLPAPAGAGRAPGQQDVLPAPRPRRRRHQGLLERRPRSPSPSTAPTREAAATASTGTPTGGSSRTSSSGPPPCARAATSCA